MLRFVRRLEQPSLLNHLSLSSTHLLNPPPCYYINNNPKNNNVFSCSSYYIVSRSCRSLVGTSAIDLALRSVVKVLTATSEHDEHCEPWCAPYKRQHTGSGFVISGKRILTNAHVVVDHMFIQVRKLGSPKNYTAKVKAIGHECDLAILVVRSKEFWKGMNSLELGDIPSLQDAVFVIGYPKEEDYISVTKGFVSKVESIEYEHGCTRLMAIQIGASIIEGNSGGPAILGDAVVGVAFQNNALNVGYIIPIPVIKHFITCVDKNGKYAGVCSIGLTCQCTENSQLREYFRMHPDMTGALVSKINPLSQASKVLKKYDVLLSFDGVRIENDGTVFFRNGEKIPFDHLVSMKKPNETIYVKVLRHGEELEFSIKLHPLQPLVPVRQFDKPPSYFIFAGLVFIPLTQRHIRYLNHKGPRVPYERLSDLALREMPKTSSQQLVILSEVWSDSINIGYEGLDNMQVKKVNGIIVENLNHLRELVVKCDKESIRFDLDDEKVKKVNGIIVENLNHLRELVVKCDKESIRFDLDDEKVIVLNYKMLKEEFHEGIWTDPVVHGHSVEPPYG